MNEMELILTDVFGCSRADLYLNKPILKQKEFSRIDKILNKRAKHEPLQYALGYADFFGLKFKVNKNALIPRPETEILVEETLKLAHQSTPPKARLAKGGNAPEHQLRVLDVGTGSGCIAIALSKFLENAEIIAIDISKKALDLAKENAKIHNADKNSEVPQAKAWGFLPSRKNTIAFIPRAKARGFLRGIKFLQSDLFDNDFFKNGVKFDIIVSNPPYVPTTEIGVLDKSILNEPKKALDGGREGLDFYRKIIKQAPSYMKSNGFLIMEMGFSQYPEIKKIFEEDKKFEVVSVVKDYGNIDRIIVARRNG